MDSVANEIDVPGVVIKGFPSIYWFKGDDKVRSYVHVYVHTSTIIEHFFFLLFSPYPTLVYVYFNVYYLLTRLTQ